MSRRGGCCGRNGGSRPWNWPNCRCRCSNRFGRSSCLHWQAAAATGPQVVCHRGRLGPATRYTCCGVHWLASALWKSAPGRCAIRQHYKSHAKKTWGNFTGALSHPEAYMPAGGQVLRGMERSEARSTTLLACSGRHAPFTSYSHQDPLQCMCLAAPPPVQIARPSPCARGWVQRHHRRCRPAGAAAVPAAPAAQTPCQPGSCGSA